MKARDDVVLTRASGITLHLYVQGDTLRDLLQDIAASTVTTNWSDAIDATYYITNPRDYDLTAETAEAKLDQALDVLAGAVPWVSIALSPEQAEDLYQKLGELR